MVDNNNEIKIYITLVLIQSNEIFKLDEAAKKHKDAYFSFEISFFPISSFLVTKQTKDIKKEEKREKRRKEKKEKTSTNNNSPHAT